MSLLITAVRCSGHYAPSTLLVGPLVQAACGSHLAGGLRHTYTFHTSLMLPSIGAKDKRFAHAGFARCTWGTTANRSIRIRPCAPALLPTPSHVVTVENLSTSAAP